MASASLSAAMMMTAAAPVVTSLPVMAASSTNTDNNTADTKDLAHADVIDMSKTGSITVHKYDITSAEAAGAYTMGQYKATGQTDMRVENALSKYAIQGVQFTYLRLGNVEQYSNTTADGSQLKVVYEIPTALADILKLSEADATVMTGDGISTPCDNTGVLHYTSTQINDALDAILKADDVAAKKFVEDSFREDQQHFAIVDDQDDEYLGTISLKNIDLKNKNAEYAISTRKKARGTGANQKATESLLKYGFDKLQLHRIYLNVLSSNKRAISFYIKCGFIYEGKFKDHLFIDDRYQDLEWYAICKK